MANVTFYSTTPAQYLALATKDIDTLYFLTNGQLYKGDMLLSNNAVLIPSGENYPVTGVTNTFYAKASGECALWNGSDYDIISLTAVTELENFEDRINSSVFFAINAIGIIQKTITHVESLNISNIGEYGFLNCKQLESVNLPNALSINNYAFKGCDVLSSINLYSLTTIGDNSFDSCTSLTTIYIPNVTTIGSSAFNNCTSLTNIDLPKATTIGNYAFQNLNLINVNIPNVTYIDMYAFKNCANLTTVNLSNSGASISSSAFQECTSLVNIDLSNVNIIGVSAFKDCTSLTNIDLSVINSINNSAFQNCTSLESVIIRTTEIPTLANVNAFSNTPIASGTGYIYVPDNLVNNYKAASNWKVYKNQIKSINELPNNEGE